MRPNTYTDDLAAARILRCYEDHDRTPWPGCLLLLAAVSILFWSWAFAFTAPTQPAPIDCGEIGTDWYYECTTGEEIDLSIQDEADTLTSTERNSADE